jgi:hypothetical protein
MPFGLGETSIIHVSLLNAPLITPSPKKKRLKKTALRREDFVLNDYLKEILVGLLLGDLYGKKKRRLYIV